MNRSFWPATALVILLASCASLSAPEPTVRPALPRTTSIEDSVLTLPIRVPLTQVSTWGQNLVPSIFSGSGSGKQTIDMLLLKQDWNYWWNYELSRSPLALSFEGPTVSISSQLTGKLFARWDTVPGEAWAPIEARARVKMEVRLTEDWKLSSRSKVGIEVTKATLPLGFTLAGNWFGLSLNIAAPLSEAIQPALGPLSRELDNRLTAIDLRPTVSTLWAELQQARSVPATPGLWFSLGPQSASLGPLEVGNDWVGMRLQLKAQPSLSLGKPPQLTPVALPPLKSADSLASGLSLLLPVNLSWEEAAKQAMAKLPEDRTVTLPQGGTLTIEGLRAKTDADKVVVRVKARVTPSWGGSIPAVLWVAARPVWDTSSNHLKLVEAQLEVQSQDLVAQTASWLLQKSWIKDLEKTWDWDLGPELERARTQASQALAQQKLSDHLQLSVAIDTMAVQELRLADEGPEALVHLEGSGTLVWIP